MTKIKKRPEENHMKERNNKLAPCGVFCGACPSYKKTCLGCASENKDQKRTSKWSCKIRNCCYNSQNKNYCIECEKFPCQKLKNKLIDTHPDDIRFKYRHEIPEIFVKMKDMDIKDYLEFQEERWRCPFCGGTIHFYKYKCSKCGKKMKV